jgi:hypothetical protein
MSAVRADRRPSVPSPSAAGLLLVASVASLVFLAVLASPAAAQQPPFNRSIDPACPIEVQTLDRFPDVAGGAHEATINCIAYYGLTQGQTAASSAYGRVYEPSGSVTRGQMASFVAGALEFAVQDELPLGDGFPDAAGVHERNIRKLVGAGIVSGLGDGTYGPGLAVTRAQMATFVAGAIETALGVELTAEPVFPDVSGPHAANIDKLAGVGVVSGRPDGTYGPQEAVSRAQMASFLAQALAELADRGVFPDQPIPGIVSSFTTPLVPGQSRNTNIHLAADLIDGDVIPGGVTSYSLNEGIGERTRERGFVGNGYIDEDGDIISVVGGGVSQMGTTFLNAAWFAGIQIDDFRQHTIYFERYPMCREATLAWNVLDVVVTNGSPYDITIDTSHTSESVTVSFISLPWASVDSWIGPPTDVTGGIGGPFSVECGRTITYPDDSSHSESFSWRYNEGYPG